MADFPLFSAGAGIERLHPDPTLTQAMYLRLTKPTAANTKSDWTEITAATTRAYTGLFIASGNGDTSSNSANMGSGLADIAIGTTPIIENILAFNAAGGQYDPQDTPLIYVPLAVPAGVQLQARCQLSDYASAATAHLGVWGVPFDPMMPAPFGRATTYGANTGTSQGVTVDCGTTAHTRVRQQIVASTANPIRYLLACFGTDGNTTRALGSFLVDIESNPGVKLVSNLRLTANANENIDPTYFAFPVSVPAGSELNIYAQCSSNSAGARTFDVVLIGLD